MTIRIGPPYWQTQWEGDAQQEVGAYFDSLAGVGNVVGAPYMPPYRPMPVMMPPRPMWAPPQAPPFMGPGIPSQRIIPTVPGAPAIGVKLQPLGFGSVTFTATSGTALPATTRPQKPFKGRRLVCALARTGTTATGLVSIASLTIGVNNQFVSTGAVGADAFGPGAFDCNVELSACSTALDITVNYTISAAPTMTDTVAISTTLFGETVGS